MPPVQALENAGAASYKLQVRRRDLRLLWLSSADQGQYREERERSSQGDLRCRMGSTSRPNASFDLFPSVPRAGYARCQTIFDFLPTG